jgi:glyoxylase-like metal-dependent hydrolase (beta-lactamase superfamily II)
LIDPSVSNAREQAALTDFLKSENLKVVRVLNTHLHLDHILGNAFAERTFGIKAEAHKDDTFLLDAQKEQSQMFGLPCNDLAPALGNYLNDGDIIEIAEIRLQVIHVAGHSPGGLAFFCENPGKVNGQDNVPPLLFPGDIIFAGSRGRSDLYGGDEFALVSGIKSKLLTLPAETVVFPGHGPSTTIGNEKMWY